MTTTQTPDRAPTWLNGCAHNVFSQFGEDGIIAAALKTIGTHDGWCVEFGAWDGIRHSNTRQLILNQGYAAVLIEGDAAKARALTATYADNPKVIPRQAVGGFEAADGLDALLAATPIPQEFDVLSIDIDGNDYHVWDAIARYRPKLVLVEYNPTIPNPVRFVQPRDRRVAQGCSLLALVELGRRKGYELVAATHTNGVFGDARFFPRFGIADNSVPTLRTDESRITYIFNGYDGTVFMRGYGRVNWHRIPYRTARLQQVPRWLRGFGADYGPMKRWLARWYRAWVAGSATAPDAANDAPV